MLLGIKSRIVLFMALSSILLSVFGGCGGASSGGNSPLDLYVRAVGMRDNNENDEAIKHLDSAIKKDEEFSLAYSLKGDIYRETQQNEKSAEAYEKATELNAWSLHDFFYLGKVYETMMKFAQAVKAYVRACELDPEHVEAHVNAAKCYNKIEAYDSAITYGQLAEQLAPDNAELQQILGDAYVGMEDHEQAVNAYKRAMEIDSANPEIMTSLAVVYLKTQRDEPAKELLLSVIELDPQNGKAHRNFGYYYLREYEKVAKHYRDSFGQPGVEKEYLESLVAQGDELTAEAVFYYRRAVEIDETDWDANRGLGVALIIDGKQPDGSIEESAKLQAIEYWRRSIQLNPDQPRVQRLRELIAKYRT